jgi:hypothetical protein
MFAKTNSNSIFNKQSPTAQGVCMYTPEGAQFQEACLRRVGGDKSLSGLIGKLVTEINNNRITVAEATAQFAAAIAN